MVCSSLSSVFPGNKDKSAFSEASGIPLEKVLFNGNSKSDAKLRAARSAGHGTVSVDSLQFKYLNTEKKYLKEVGTPKSIYALKI
jgi:diaminopimelate decarboxylase